MRYRKIILSVHELQEGVLLYFREREVNVLGFLLCKINIRRMISPSDVLFSPVGYSSGYPIPVSPVSLHYYFSIFIF